MKAHLVCNAHLDPVWLWRWDEGAAEALSTFRAAVEFCDEFDGFIFNHNEAVLYEWVEESDPKLFDKIKQLIVQGKWRIIGGWFLQPDCNMPMGESFIRQIVYGRHYFKSKFGVTPTTAINFDSFGHSRGLVQILKKSGYDSYVVCRPAKNNYAFDDADFIWRGYDGSEVIVHRSDENYNSLKGKAGEELRQWLQDHKALETGIFLWGVGNHGGGPSRKDLQDIAEIIKENPDISHSYPEAYFDQLKGKKMPVVERGLNYLCEGCYTSQIRVKQKHRQLENDIYMVEKMASSASMQGLMAYPERELSEAIYDMMTAEFHDALPGSGTKSVEEDTLRILDHGLEITARLKTKACFALSSGQPKLIDGTIPMMVYNPHPYPIDTIVECDFGLPAQNWKNEFSYPVAFQNEKQIPCQAEKEESNFNMDWRKRAVIKAKLAPSSMNRIDFHFEVKPKRPIPVLKQKDGKIVFCNDIMELEINCNTGWIDRYCVRGIDYLKENAFRPVVINDTCSPWGIDVKGELNEFTLMSRKDASTFCGVSDRVFDPVRVIEEGDVRVVVEALMKFNNSFICQRYILERQGSRIQVETRVFWNEKTRLLKLCIPTIISDGKYIGQTVFGREVLKNDGSEVISHAWNAVEDDLRAVVCINDSTYGSSCKDGEFKLTLLRSAGYSAASFTCGSPYAEDMFAHRMEQGERCFNFWIDAGSKEETLAEIDTKAAIYNQKPYALTYCPSGEGEIPQQLIILDNPNIQLSAFQKSAESDEYIVRLYEPSGTPAECNVKIPYLCLNAKIQFQAFEIKTFTASENGLKECGLIKR